MKRAHQIVPLRVLDLYAGLEGWASAFRGAGHEVVTLDLDPSFRTTVVADALEVTADQLGGPGAYDVVLASPPCEGFSVASIGNAWNLTDGVATPKSDTARLGVALALATVRLVRDLDPSHGFAIENPTGMMRHVLGFDRATVEGLELLRWQHPDARAADRTPPSVTYCTLGFDYRKPTDLWVGGPLVGHLKLPAPCATDRTESVVLNDGRTFRVNRRTGRPCHEVAARGARTGVQGLATYAERSLVPTELSAALEAAAVATGLDRVGQSPDLADEILPPPFYDQAELLA